MQRGQAPNWRLPPAPGATASGDYEVQLVGEPAKGSFATPYGDKAGRDVREDYGLIVRGPHPKHPRRMVTIMAGPHSLGTGAACLAATKSHLVGDRKGPVGTPIYDA